jgi:hypothetical protein
VTDQFLDRSDCRNHIVRALARRAKRANDRGQLGFVADARAGPMPFEVADLGDRVTGHLVGPLHRQRLLFGLRARDAAVAVRRQTPAAHDRIDRQPLSDRFGLAHQDGDARTFAGPEPFRARRSTACRAGERAVAREPIAWNGSMLTSTADNHDVPHTFAQRESPDHGKGDEEHAPSTV